MRVLLLYPPISMRERYSSAIGNSGGRQIPLGVFSLAAFLRRHGHQVRVVDGEATGMTAQEIAECAAEFAPPVVGIGSTAVAFHRARELAAEIRSRLPRSTILIGGPHASACVEHAMGSGDFDAAVLGEGEQTLLELIEAVDDGGTLRRIPGLAIRADGELCIGPTRPRIDDLDSLPFPAYDLIPDITAYNPPPCNYQRLPVASLVTSRGCPNACTFCDQSVFGRTFRQRSPDHVADEIQWLIRSHGVREIAFLDDTFTLRSEFVYRLFELLDARGLRFPWTCMSRINTVDRELLEFMKGHGCWHVSFGIESGDEEILRRIRKRISLDAVRQVVSWSAELGLRSKGFFIIGHPGETLETLDQTIELALELPLDDIVATLNTPIPGSVQHAEAAQWGSLDETDWGQFNYWRPVFVPAGLDARTLLAKQRELYRRFYLRPRVAWRYARSFVSTSGLRRLGALGRSLPFLLPARKDLGRVGRGA